MGISFKLRPNYYNLLPILAERHRCGTVVYDRGFHNKLKLLCLTLLAKSASGGDWLIPLTKLMGWMRFNQLALEKLLTDKAEASRAAP